MKKSLITIIIIVIILILAGAGYFAYTKGVFDGMRGNDAVQNIDQDINQADEVVEKIEEKVDHVGKYTYGNLKLGERSGTIYVYPDSENSIVFYLDLSRGAPSYNSGSLLGKAILDKNKKDTFVYYSDVFDFNKDDVCNFKITFTPKEASIITVNDKINCGFGYGVNADGVFIKQSNEIPVYYISGEGEKIYFKDAVKNLNIKNAKPEVSTPPKTNTTTTYMCEGRVKIVREQDSPSLPPRVSYLRVSDNVGIASYGDFGAYIRPEYFSIDRAQIEQGYSFNETNFCKYLKN